MTIGLVGQFRHLLLSSLVNNDHHRQSLGFLETRPIWSGTSVPINILDSFSIIHRPSSFSCVHMGACLAVISDELFIEPFFVCVLSEHAMNERPSIFRVAKALLRVLTGPGTSPAHKFSRRRFVCNKSFKAKSNKNLREQLVGETLDGVWSI